VNPERADACVAVARYFLRLSFQPTGPAGEERDAETRAYREAIDAATYSELVELVKRRGRQPAARQALAALERALELGYQEAA
jgi:hypothetical protein